MLVFLLQVQAKENEGNDANAKRKDFNDLF